MKAEREKQICFCTTAKKNKFFCLSQKLLKKNHSGCITLIDKLQINTICYSAL